MDKQLILKIDEMIEEYTDSLISDTIRLVNINSEESEPLLGAPFGKGPREVLDTVLEMGDSEGFCTTDYGVGVISVALESGQPDLGIWAHGDVVPAGDGWSYEPYNACLYKNCIIGRGATDNKGQLASIFNLFKIFKKLGVKLIYNPALYVGSNEESGMKDMVGVAGNPDAKGFINVCKMPKLSLVPDSGFPVAYGARGLTSFKFKSKTPLHGFTFAAGQNDSPGLATAVFDTLDFPDNLKDCTIIKNDKTTVTAFSEPRHSSQPDANGNMITFLSSALLESGAVCEDDRYILEFFRDVSLDINGDMLGINVESKSMPPVVVYAKSVDFKDGYAELETKIRYPIDITFDEIKEKLDKVCEEKGFELSFDEGHHPYLNPDDTDVVKALTKVANDVTGDDKKPYICGSTYAHYLPNAYVYGMNGCNPPDDFPKGHGGAHGIDECVSIDRLKRAMRIYARALLALNEIEW